MMRIKSRSSQRAASALNWSHLRGPIWRLCFNLWILTWFSCYFMVWGYEMYYNFSIDPDFFSISFLNFEFREKRVFKTRITLLLLCKLMSWLLHGMVKGNVFSCTCERWNSQRQLEESREDSESSRLTMASRPDLAMQGAGAKHRDRERNTRRGRAREEDRVWRKERT